MSFRLSKAAELDLLNIWRYTCRTWGENQADKYLDQLESVCANIQSGSHIVKEMPSLHADLRYCHHGRHFVFWLAEPTPLVIAFLHDQMQLVKHLTDRLPDG